MTCLSLSQVPTQMSHLLYIANRPAGGNFVGKNHYLLNYFSFKARKAANATLLINWNTLNLNTI